MSRSIRLIAAAALVAVSAAAPSAFAADLLYGSPNPPKTPESKAMSNFIENLNGASSTMKWRANFGGVAGVPRGMLKNVRDGVLHGALVIDGFTPKELAGLSVIRGMAPIGENPLAVTGAVSETVLLNCPRCLADVKALNLIWPASSSAPTYHLVCKEPVKAGDDLGGVRLRAVGENAVWMSKLGGTPVQIAFPETYQALQRGQVGCTHTQETNLRAMNLWEVAKAVYKTPLGTYSTTQFFAINGKTWDGMTAADRALIIKGIPGFLADANFLSEEDTDDIRAAAGARGVAYVDFAKPVADKIAAYKADSKSMAVEMGTKYGVPAADAEKIADVYSEKLEKWRGIVKQTTTRETYAAALQREIYDHVKF